MIGSTAGSAVRAIEERGGGEGNPVVHEDGVRGGFELSAVPLLSRSTVDRREGLRADADRLRAAWVDSRLLVVDPHGRAPMRYTDDGYALDFRPATELGPEPPDTAVFLGEEDGTSYWAATVDADDPAPAARAGWSAPIRPDDAEVGASAGWLDLRTSGALLDDSGAGLFTTAVGTLNWHRRSRFCAVCGARTTPVNCGWAQVCTGCGREEYPRTDAATICLVHDGVGVNGEHVLLARQPVWPRGRYSVLAGFVESGESLEACVIREIAEEAGIVVRDVRYLGSQPWPFPRSLMIGFAAVADRSATLRAADGEIEDARWVHRDEVRAALARPDTAEPADDPPLLLPGPVSIAGRMITSWAAAD